MSQAFAAPISPTDIATAATTVSNYMEEYRKLPTSVDVDSNLLSTAAFLEVSVKLVNDIHQNSIQNSYTSAAIQDPVNPYPGITFNDAFYRSPLSKSTYIDFVSLISASLSGQTPAPDLFIFNGSEVRYSAAMHYVSSLLRFYDFYGYLPQSLDIKVISAKNLVPASWDTPEALRHYTSAVTYHVNNPDNAYYRHTVGDYNTFMLAKSIVGNLPFYEAMEAIYNWVRSDTWILWGYGQNGHAPFSLGMRSSHEAWSMRFTTSGAHDIKMNALYRSLGIPAYRFYVYHIPESRWMNTDVHDPFGSAPRLDANGNMYEGFEDSPLPSSTRDFVNEIRNFTQYQRTTSNALPGFRNLFITVSELETYGADYVVQTAKAGGYNAVTLTVKTAYGDLYADSDVSFPRDFVRGTVYVGGEDRSQVQTAQLDPLFTAAQAQGIEVHFGFNVLADYLMGRKKYLARPNQSPNWSQWDGSVSVPSWVGMISPCITDYKELLQSALEAYLNRYPVNGIVLTEMKWHRGYLNQQPHYGSNPACSTYQSNPNWYEDILVDYLQDLVTTIRTTNPDVKISVLSAPNAKQSVVSGGWEIQSINGAQDFARMAQLVDEFILNIGGHYWLTDNFYDQFNNYGYDFEELFYDLQAQTATPISLVFNLRDEWEYPAEFFEGLYDYVTDMGASGYHLASMVSGWGEWGPAFTQSQWDKIQYMALSQPSAVPISVNSVETGRYETSGKGKDKVEIFVPTTAFNAGDGVVFRIQILDESGQPVSNATSEMTISGPESATVNSGPSDANGIAEAIWQTSAPNNKGQGGTMPGSYVATVTNVTASGYTWDGIAPPPSNFTVN
jgi:hypothetical protein